ncbi:DinB family protein [Tersicoccus sp. MR15.9]|uniref:DinB family protein n=1 Tax=Tersicoccus mangrovi TaxID=3121635 RepID=UPI002FE618B3
MTDSVTPPTPLPAKDVLHRYLRSVRRDLEWKLEGLDEMHLRMPMTRTGTNLLGLVRHATGIEAGYFGEVFDRPFPEPMPWDPEYADNDDFWTPADVPAHDVVGLYHRVQLHADATITDLPLDELGLVPWWSEERRTVSLQQILVHVITDLARHAGHADVVREAIDGSAGLSDGNDNLMTQDEQWWADYHDRLTGIAESFGGTDATDPIGDER